MYSKEVQFALYLIDNPKQNIVGDPINSMIGGEFSLDKVGKARTRITYALKNSYGKVISLRENTQIICVLEGPKWFQYVIESIKPIINKDKTRYCNCIVSYILDLEEGKFKIIDIIRLEEKMKFTSDGEKYFINIADPFYDEKSNYEEAIYAIDDFLSIEDQEELEYFIDTEIMPSPFKDGSITNITLLVKKFFTGVKNVTKEYRVNRHKRPLYLEVVFARNEDDSFTLKQFEYIEN